MPLKTQHDEQPQLNLTSMIDVVFLLLIFFMVTTTFDKMERNIDVAVPEVPQAGDAAPPLGPLVVSVFADGRLELDGQEVTLVELTSRLAEARTARGDVSVVIRGDAACAFQDVAATLSACREANISELGITVRIASDGGHHVR
jgi:biopolymer transport protein ExbD